MSKKNAGNPYKVLYWMGAALLLLLVGVVALILLAKPKPTAPPDPERTLLYMYDAANPSAPAMAAVIEESRSRGTLVALPFPAPSEAQKAYAEKSSRAAQDLLAAALQHKLHHRVFLPYSIIAKLVDAAGGITVEGKSFTGAAAISYVSEGGDQAARRASLVMLSLANAASTNGVNIGLSEGLSLARQVDTDMDLTALPDTLARWSSYASPKVEAASPDPGALAKLLLPDPPGER